MDLCAILRGVSDRVARRMNSSSWNVSQVSSSTRGTAGILCWQSLTNPPKLIYGRVSHLLPSFLWGTLIFQNP